VARGVTQSRQRWRALDTKHTGISKDTDAEGNGADVDIEEWLCPGDTGDRAVTLNGGLQVC